MPFCRFSSFESSCHYVPSSKNHVCHSVHELFMNCSTLSPLPFASPSSSSASFLFPNSSSFSARPLPPSSSSSSVSFDVHRNLFLLLLLCSSFLPLFWQIELICFFSQQTLLCLTSFKCWGGTLTEDLVRVSNATVLTEVLVMVNKGTVPTEDLEMVSQGTVRSGSVCSAESGGPTC